MAANAQYYAFKYYSKTLFYMSLVTANSVEREEQDSKEKERDTQTLIINASISSHPLLAGTHPRSQCGIHK